MSAVVSLYAAKVGLCRVLFPPFASRLRRLAAVSVLAMALAWPGTILAVDQTVTNILDDGSVGSLRQAVAAVGAGETIFFNISSSPSTIALNSDLSLSVGGVSLLNNSGGAVTVSLSGLTVITLATTSLGEVGGSSALTIAATVTSGFTAIGIYSAGAISIGSIASTGAITATAVTSEAYGLRASGGVTISGEMAGDIAATSTSGTGAYGIFGGSITIGSIAETGSITATAGFGLAYGLYGSTGVTITGEMAGDIAATATGGPYAYGIYSGGAISIGSIAETGSITATAGTDQAYGLYGSTGVTITGAMAGDIAATTGTSAFGISSGGAISIGSIASTGSITGTVGTSGAYGMSAASNVTITGEMAGGIAATVTSGFTAFGIYSGGALSIGSIASTGSITATAGTSDAYGLCGATGVTITGAMAGDIAATATTGGSAFGIYSVGAISIGSIASTGSITATAGTHTALGLYGVTGVTITGEMAGSITATATSGFIAFGIYSGGALNIGSIAETGSITGTTTTVEAYGLRATSDVTITGEMAGDIAATVTSGWAAYGIYSSGGSITIDSIASTGSITATAGMDYAYGLYAAGNVTISGGMAGTIAAIAGTHTAVGIRSGGTLNGGSAATPLSISGTVSAQANGLAVAVASDGAMNLYVTGTLSGVDASGSGEGYAIRAGTADGSGGWTTGSADNTVTLGTGAQLVGKVDLGTGTNTLGFLGTGTASNLFSGVTHLIAGDGLQATYWTLNPTAAAAYTVSDVAIHAGATLDINENVTITGATVNNGTLVFDLGVGKAYGGIISGTGGVTKTGDAALILSGATTYTGTTLVAEGQLRLTQTLNSRSVGIYAGATLELDQDYTALDYALVNGTLIVPELTVAQDATLFGSGAIAGDVVSYGLISPGNSPGTLTIAGNLTLNSGSLLAMEITPYANDLLLVSGSTTINGGTLSVAVSSGFYTSGDTFTLISSAGGITGSFDAVSVGDSSPFLLFNIDEDADSIEVSVTRLPYTIAGTSRNSMAAAAGLTGATYLATPSMQAVLGTIDFMEIGDVARGLRQMSPEPYSALDETAFSSLRLFSDTIRDRAYARRSGGETLLTAVSAGNIGRLTQLASAAGVSDAGSGLNAKGTGMGMALFVKPVGQYQSVDNGHNRTGFQSWQYGVMAGGDAQLTENFLAGFQVGFVHSNLRFRDDATSTGFSDAFLGGVYASATAGGFYADGLVQAGAAVNQLDRRIEFGSISRRPTGTYTSFLFGASLTTGYDWTFGNWTAGPVATLDYGYVSNPGFAESDPDLGLTVQGFAGNSLKTGLGAKVSGTFAAGETVVAPDLSLRWGHEFLNDSRTISARYNGSPTSGFTSRTGEPARDSLLVDAGVSFGVSESTKLYVRYSGQFLARGTHSQAGAVGVRYEF